MRIFGKKSKVIPLLSVVINTLNEEKNIAGCIESIALLADEIIVVDMKSDDRTVKIAKRLGAKIFIHERVGYVEPARNFAIDHARGKWILILDADERLICRSPQSVKELLLYPVGIDAFLIPRRNEIVGRWIQGTGWGRAHEKQLRLFKKGSVLWSNEIHSLPEVKGLKGDLPSWVDIHLDHFNYASLSDFVSRLNNYTSKEVLKFQAKGEMFSPVKMLLATKREFHNRFEPELDGSHSLVLAGCMAFYRFVAWAKLWEASGCPDLPPEKIREAVTAVFGPLGDLSEKKASPLEKTSPDIEYIGFYDDEGGWRWMGPMGVVQVSAKNVREPSRAVFNIRCVEPEKYPKFPFTVKIYVGTELDREITLSKPLTDYRVDLALPHVGRPNYVRIESETSFFPTLGGNRDTRELSVTVANFSVSPI